MYTYTHMCIYVYVCNKHTNTNNTYSLPGAGPHRGDVAGPLARPGRPLARPHRPAEHAHQQVPIQGSGHIIII